jgi:hypothetical protein
MELSLNLAWVLLAGLMFGLWMRKSPRADAPTRRQSDRRMQFVALAILLLILFPVISVTDDLQALQNPAETDCCQRRDHGCPHAHSVVPIVPSLPLPAVAELAFGFVGLTGSGAPYPLAFPDPAMAPIQNRPPPIA